MLENIALAATPFSIAGLKGLAYNVGMFQEAQGLRPNFEHVFGPDQRCFIPII